MASLQDVYAPIQKELRDVERIIKDSLTKGSVPEIRRINQILVKSPGKRLRPAMAILSAFACMGERRKRNDAQYRSIANAAAAIELIHMSTLVHDDVMDSSLVRHGKQTINALHGDNVAICAGDYLLARAFMLLGKAGNAKLMESASCAVKDVCEGQVLQIRKRHDTSMTIKEYGSIIDRKTAALFKAACESGEIASGTKRSVLSSFGFCFGRGFQMIDDYLDIVSDEKTLGKQPGENIRTGELTLPALLLLRSVPKQSRVSLAKRCMEDIGTLRKMMQQHGVGQRVQERVQKEMAKAKRALDGVPPSPYKDSFYHLIELSVSRLRHGQCDA